MIFIKSYHSDTLWRCSTLHLYPENDSNDCYEKPKTMSDLIRSINLGYCKGARFIRETLSFYNYPEGKQDKREFSYGRPKSEMTFDESGKLRDCVSHHDDVSFACRLFYDKKDRLGFVLMMNTDKSKVTGGVKYVYDDKNRLSSHRFIHHFDGFSAAPIEGNFQCFTEAFRYRGKKVKINHSTSRKTTIRRSETYIPALHDGTYDFKQHLAPASLIHNRMLVSYLFVEKPYSRVEKSNITGMYFCTRNLVFNEKGHWTSLLFLDHNEQPWIEYRREISYFDNISPAAFQVVQNEKD